MSSCYVVTGAASGIGREVAEALLLSGENIAAVDLNGERLNEIYGGNNKVHCIACDLLAEGAAKNLGAAIKERFEGVSGFVHAAGFDAVAPLGMIQDAKLQSLVAIHAGFPVQFLGWLAKKGNHAEKTSCVLISSLSVHEGAKGHVAYAAAKGAVEGILNPAAAELIAKGIRLNEVVLGVVETEMSKGWMNKLSPEQLEALKGEYPLGLGSTKAVADVICFLLSKKSEWIAGQKIVCDGGHSLV